MSDSCRPLFFVPFFLFSTILQLCGPTGKTDYHAKSDHSPPSDYPLSDSSDLSFFRQ